MTVTAATWCLASPVTQPRNTNFTDSVRYGAALPALPVAPAAKFPFTAAGVGGGVIQDSFNPTNYLNSALGQLRPGASLPENTAGYNANGNPSIFRTTNTAAGAFMGQYPGTSGTRALIRGAGMSNFDLSLGKFFGLPWEGHRFALKRLTPSTT